jgi:hypothetical protein
MKRPEQDIQRAVVQHLETRGVPGLVYFAVPNGGYRSPHEAKILKGQGVKPGVSDLILFGDTKHYALELKAPGKKPTEAQIEFANAVLAQAAGYADWADSLDKAIAILERWGLLRGVAQTKRPDLTLATPGRA